MTTWRYAASSDVGLVREINEDSFLVTPEIAIVADGMGGHAAGEIASAIAVDVVANVFTVERSEVGLRDAVAAANDAIQQDAVAHPERAGMGTTVVALGLVPSSTGLLPVVINVGDSRAYQLRDGAMRQITLDHSVAEEWVRQGRLSPEEAAVHPRRHQLTRTLGVDGLSDPDVFPLALEPGDRILLCSDGLCNELSDDEIASLASPPHTLEEATALLVAGANRGGGRDNITVVLLEFDEVTARAPQSATGTVPASVSSSVVPPAPRVVGTEAPVASTPTRTARRRSRRFTWRTAVFLVALIAVLGSSFFVLRWYAQSNYYLASNGTNVAVYQGQPGGVLWFKPKEVYTTPYLVSDLRDGDHQALLNTISEPSLTDAKSYAAYLYHEWKTEQQNLNGATTTTSSTTTTVAAG